MKSWTHWVYCEEVIPTYGSNYDVRAVQVNGQWRLAERNLAGGLRYGQPLTVTQIGEKRVTDGQG